MWRSHFLLHWPHWRNGIGRASVCRGGLKICSVIVPRGGETFYVCRTKTLNNHWEDSFWFTADAVVQLISVSVFSPCTMFLWLWIHGKISHRGVVGGRCSTLVLWLRVLGAGLWPICFVVECKMALVGMEATVGLSLWSAAVGTTLGNMSWLHQHIFKGGCSASSLWSKWISALTGFQHNRHSVLWKSIFHCIVRAIPAGVKWNESITERSLSQWQILTHKSKSHHPVIRPSFIFFIL